MAQSTLSNNQSKNSLKHDFFYCFRPFYYFSRIFGYTPFSINFVWNNAIYRPALKALDILWFIFAILVYISTIIDYYVERVKLPYTSSQILNESAWWMMLSITSFGVFIIALEMYNRFKFVGILNKFIQIDEKVHPLSIPFETFGKTIQRIASQDNKDGIHKDHLIVLFFFVRDFSIAIAQNHAHVKIDSIFLGVSLCRYRKSEFISIMRESIGIIGYGAWWLLDCPYS